MKNIDKEIVNEMINDTKKRLSELKRKQRADTGRKRNKYNSNLPIKYRQYLSRANSKGREFTLTVEQFNELIIGTCVFCGSQNKQTIDRINSAEGYTPENTQTACYTCNTMKNNLSVNDFLKHINKIKNHLNI